MIEVDRIPPPPSLDGDPWERPGTEPWRVCAGSRCRAGRLVVDAVDGDEVEGHFVEVLASSQRHPNGAMRHGPLSLLEPRHRLEVGQTYVVILDRVGMRHFEAVFAGPDDEETMSAMAAIHRSPSSNGNSLAWQARRRAWAGLRQRLVFDDHLFQPTVRAWAESDDQRFIAFVIGTGAVFIYDDHDGRIHVRTLGQVGAGNLTFEAGRFVVWRANERLAEFSPPGEPADPADTHADAKEPAPLLRDVVPETLKIDRREDLESCVEQMCYGGVVQLDSKDGEGEWTMYTGHFVQVVASSTGHPNGRPPPSVSFGGDPALGQVGDLATVVVRRVSGAFVPHAVGWYPGRSEAALADIRTLLTHEAVFDNDAASRRVHVLFDGLRRASPGGEDPGSMVGVWAVDPEFQVLMTPHWSYDARSREIDRHVFQKSGPPGYNRVTWDEGMFTLWYDDDEYMSVG